MMERFEAARSAAEESSIYIYIYIHTGEGRSGENGFLGFVFYIIGLQALIGNFMEILLKKTNRF